MPDSITVLILFGMCCLFVLAFTYLLLKVK
jgi:hypothetical protein